MYIFLKTSIHQNLKNNKKQIFNNKTKKNKKPTPQRPPPHLDYTRQKQKHITTHSAQTAYLKNKLQRQIK